MKCAAETRPLAAYSPPSPIADLIRRHRRMLDDIMEKHRSEVARIFPGTSALPRRKVAA